MISILFLTGCSNTLKCNVETKSYSSKIKIVFKNNKPKKYILKDIREFNIYDKDLNNYYKNKKKEYISLIAIENAKIFKGKDYVLSKINYDFNSDIKCDFILIDKDDNLAKSIEKIESSGYICN